MFGHHPTSTILSPHTDLGIRDVLAPGLVYLCGHLHNLHGIVETMFARHKVLLVNIYLYIKLGVLLLPWSCLRITFLVFVTNC